ncbi:unnamed protein product [Sphenostylis stenocarpa]|uniref:Uncharacterized protein n=1 Tax=Sphenostylis stenocarpa TaxID=92480 RepID=A0AA86SXY9_9FABA|nr:unnamed protein product [Sphenostylis stenocarpa]
MGQPRNLCCATLVDRDTNFWNNTPTRKRSRVEYRQMTPMEMFHKQLLSLCRSEKQPNESSPEEDILVYNVNHFIPSNEIGLGVVLLKTDPGSLSCSSSTNEQAQPQSSATAP